MKKVYSREENKRFLLEMFDRLNRKQIAEYFINLSRFQRAAIRNVVGSKEYKKILKKGGIK